MTTAKKNALAGSIAQMAAGVAIIDASQIGGPFKSAQLRIVQRGLDAYGLPKSFLESLRSFNRRERTLTSLVEEFAAHLTTTTTGLN